MGEPSLIWHHGQQMSKRASSSRFPVTVTQLPVVRCQICKRTLPYRPGQTSAVLTSHYAEMHPEELGTAPEPD
jgi:hypothetical protein